MGGSIYSLRSVHVLTLCVVGLLSVGLLMVQSASMTITGDPNVRFQWAGPAAKHALFVGLALIAYFTAAHVDYRKLIASGPSLLKSPIVWLMLIAILMSVAVLKIGIEVNGARPAPVRRR